MKMKKDPGTLAAPGPKVLILAYSSITGIVASAIESIIRGICSTTAMGWRRCSTTIELISEAIDRIGNVHQTIIVHVTSINAGVSTAQEKYVESINDIRDVERTIDVAIAAIEPASRNWIESHASVNGVRCVSSTVHHDEILYRSRADDL